MWNLYLEGKSQKGLILKKKTFNFIFDWKFFLKKKYINIYTYICIYMGGLERAKGEFC